MNWDRLSLFFYVAWTWLFIMFLFMLIDRRDFDEFEGGDTPVVSIDRRAPDECEDEDAAIVGKENFSESGDPGEGRDGNVKVASESAAAENV